MKKSMYLIPWVLFFCNAITAQVGLGTTTPNATLDIRSSNQAAPANTDGILIPRIDNFPAVDPTAAQQGMLVYLTTTQGLNTPGFYFWNNSVWVPIIDIYNGTGWSLTGNAGTNPSFNFIGTPDNVDVVFRRNNVRAGLLGATNTSFGTGALANMVSGQALYNSAFGVNALNKTTTGDSNTAAGKDALFENTTGSYNTAAGFEALKDNVTGNYNIAMGQGALLANVSGSYNIAVGSQTLMTSPDGEYNIAIGSQSLRYLPSGGEGNIALGEGALSSSNLTATADNNIAIGASALSGNRGGSNNIAIGELAGNGIGSHATLSANSMYNIAIGASAMHGATFGGGREGNVAIGRNALSHNQLTGDFNVAVGAEALDNVTSGSNNIAIGYQAIVPSPTASNQVRIGNGSISNAYIAIHWTTGSDRRFKSDIRTSPIGLDFIRSLHPVSYFRNNDENRKTEYGFIAQELEAVLEQFGEHNTGIVSKDDKGMYGVRYNDLIAPMVKAIQEQREIIDSFRSSNEEYQSEIHVLKLALENQKKQYNELLDRLIKLETKEGLSAN